MKKYIFRIVLAVVLLAFVFASSCSKTEGEEHIKKEQRQMFLTFDDGPSRHTIEILDILDEHNVKATFFLVGQSVEKYPDAVSQIFERGHAVGIHSYTHNYKQIYSSPQALKKDINACLCAIKGVNDKYFPKFYRFPGGSFGLNEKLKAVPSGLGLVAIDWNASCGDCEIKAKSAYPLIENAKQSAGEKNRVVMLLHDASGKQSTVSALPEIIKYFTKKEFSFLSMEKY